MSEASTRALPDGWWPVADIPARCCCIALRHQERGLGTSCCARPHRYVREQAGTFYRSAGFEYSLGKKFAVAFTAATVPCPHRDGCASPDPPRPKPTRSTPTSTAWASWSDHHSASARCTRAITSCTRSTRAAEPGWPVETVKHLVVGAGVTGPAFADWLDTDDLLIFEAEREIGGYCRTVARDGLFWDYPGTSSTSATRRSSATVERMEGQEVRRSPGEARIWHEGAPGRLPLPEEHPSAPAGAVYRVPVRPSFFAMRGS
ncbi:MAG: NAD(P)-binding protein [Deltaproteobacteria bacterium]|nr:NAD(P)-binding protein [Deltaproteobacteria bacterium]